MLLRGSLLTNSGPITCTWCGTRYTRHQRNCTNCGGPLPGPTPPEPGEKPPPPPRQIPKAYVRRLYLWGNVVALIGVIFTVVGAFVTVSITWLALEVGPEAAAGSAVGGIFVLIGLPMWIVGMRKARSQLRALREGHAVRGQIEELYQDTTESINGRHPWAVVYSYEVRGHAYQGKVKSWSSAGEVLRLYAVGSPVHVLHVPDEPRKSALYPPIR